jgi:hypothetical protein
MVEGMVQLGGLIEASYVVDSGADRTVVPIGVVECLQDADPTVQVVHLDEPITVEVADGRTVMCASELAVGMRLMTAAGVVNVPNVCCLVMPGDGGDVLIGNDLMVSLGIDVKRMLEQLATSPLVETSTSVFPFPDEDLPATSELAVLLESKVTAALDAGMASQHADELRSMLSEFSDTWRLNLALTRPRGWSHCASS